MVTGARRRQLGLVHQPGPPGGLLQRARPRPGRGAPSASSRASAGTRVVARSTPSNRAVYSRTAAAPRWRTSSHTGRTCSAAAATSSAARGRTPDRLTRLSAAVSRSRRSIRSIRGITRSVYGEWPVGRRRRPTMRTRGPGLARAGPSGSCLGQGRVLVGAGPGYCSGAVSLTVGSAVWSEVGSAGWPAGRPGGRRARPGTGGLDGLGRAIFAGAAQVRGRLRHHDDQGDQHRPEGQRALGPQRQGRVQVGSGPIGQQPVLKRGVSVVVADPQHQRGRGQAAQRSGPARRARPSGGPAGGTRRSR